MEAICAISWNQSIIDMVAFDKLEEFLSALSLEIVKNDKSKVIVFKLQFFTMYGNIIIEKYLCKVSSFDQWLALNDRSQSGGNLTVVGKHFGVYLIHQL